MIEDYTRDKDQLLRVTVWRNAAIADGWRAEATYGDSEPIERAATLTRDGFKCMILTRTMEHGWYEAGVSIWGPDRLAITPPLTYDWDAIVAGLRKCGYCNATDVGTMRVSFAGRCCSDCRPMVSAQLEEPGWCD